MTGGDTAPDNVVAGYITAEQIALSTTPTGTTYEWSLAKPTGSSARADLSASTGASVSFTPDVAGNYGIACTVDETTTYTLLLAVANVGQVITLGILQFMPLHDAQVPTPATGRSVYYSIESAKVVEKRPDGTVHPFTTT